MTKIETKDIDGVLCISTGALNDALPFVMQAKEIESWGFVPHARLRAGLWWTLPQARNIIHAACARARAVEEQL